MTRQWSSIIRPGVSPRPFAPGCGHGILMGLILRAIDELKMDMKQDALRVGHRLRGLDPEPPLQRGHPPYPPRRALAFATGAKLFNPKLNVMVISGDGDLGSIGGNHLIHAARRKYRPQGRLREQHDLRHDGRAGGLDHAPGRDDGHDRTRETLTGPSTSAASSRRPGRPTWPGIR